MKLNSHSPPLLAERYPIAFLAAVVEFLLIVAGSYIAHYLRFDDWSMEDHYLAATFIVALMVVLCQVLLGNYLSWRGRQFFRQLGRVYSAWLLALAFVTSLAVFLKVSDTYSRIWLASTLAVAIALITVFRFLVFLFLRRIRSRGRNLKRALIVEAGASAADLKARQG